MRVRRTFLTLSNLIHSFDSSEIRECNGGSGLGSHG
jgi:hypothetical protein